MKRKVNSKTPYILRLIQTVRMVEAGRILGVRVLDHMIIGEGKYFSFKDEGLI